MRAPLPERIVPALVRLYGLALWLYPTSFRAAYAEEMRVIFRLRLEDAVRSGRSAFLGLLFQETVTLPAGVIAAHAQAGKSSIFITFLLDVFHFLAEKGSKMAIRQHFPQSADQTPWLIAILSLAPFILPGPLAPLLNYHPWWDPNALPLIAVARVPLTVGLLLLGFLIGALRHFPRWSYLYGLYSIIFLPVGLIRLIDSAIIPINPRIEGNILSLLIVLLVVLLILARRRLPFLRPFFTNIRRDWTLLSYTLYACTFFLTASNDLDESPVYNLQVLLPSLITWLGALAYLRQADPLKKVGALFGAVLLGVLIWWWPVFGGWSSSFPASFLGLLVASGMLVFWWVTFGGLILAPILINIVFRPPGETT